MPVCRRTPRAPTPPSPLLSSVPVGRSATRARHCGSGLQQRPRRCLPAHGATMSASAALAASGWLQFRDQPMANREGHGKTCRQVRAGQPTAVVTLSAETPAGGGGFVVTKTEPASVQMNRPDAPKWKGLQLQPCTRAQGLPTPAPTARAPKKSTSCRVPGWTPSGT